MSPLHLYVQKLFLLVGFGHNSGEAFAAKTLRDLATLTCDTISNFTRLTPPANLRSLRLTMLDFRMRLSLRVRHTHVTWIGDNYFDFLAVIVAIRCHLAKIVTVKNV